RRSKEILIMLCLVGVYRCLITAPNIIHLGEEETISVQLHGATKAISVTLSIKHPIGGQVLSERRTVTLSGVNQYQAVVILKVDPVLYRRFDVTRNSGYIQLVAESEVLDKGKEMANILVSARRGYLFIQTDKPIYNPGELVNYRIFTLDNYMLPVKEVVYVQIFVSIVQYKICLAHFFRAGHWKITASFSNFLTPETSVEIEVREYVLPLFEVNIQASKPYLMLNSEIFPFSVSARYTYGKGVNGIAYVRFGLTDSKGERTYLTGIEKQTAVILSAELTSAAANQSKPNIEGMYLYIAATVLEKASGELEEAESSSVKIVTSPYIVDLSKTKPYFTPGGIFSILGTTTYPDGSRVARLKVKATITITPAEVLIEESRSDNMGAIVISFPVPKLARTMSIKMSVEGHEGEVITNAASMTSTAIQPEGNSYLSLEVEHQVLEPGQSLQVTFRDIAPPGTARPSHIYYMVVSKGKVLKVGSVQRTDLTSTSLAFSADMVPSFHLLAYYYIEPEGTRIVADSVWVDVKDVCKGKIEIAPLSELKPAQTFDVLVSTELDSKVALSAVDSAVYILNKRNKLSPQKMFEYMNSYDLACSVGGGEDSSSVLQRIGLTFICNCAAETPIHKCYNERHRHKRDVEFNKLINSFKHAERKCCDDGRKLGLMLRSCEQRMKRTTHQSESCRQAFKKCCEAATALRKKERLKSRTRNLGRGEEDDLIDEAAIYLRSYFPQSWMWVLLTGYIRKHSAIAPDSITTWEVQAVGISQTKGFCIADPKPLRVFQDFFLSVKLPYSVKRNEQLEVKAVVYNYKHESLEVKVKMQKVEGLCSAGEGDVVQEVTVPGQSAVAVYFTVVPLIIGKISINVLAYASPSAQDRIQKELRVLGEGELVSIQTHVNIFSIRMNITDCPVLGGVMGESVDNCLNLEGVDNLIQLPTGCAEQTMVKMSPAIHAIKYLDATHQWLFLKAERREEAQAMIQAGYNRVLTYKKDDGSYGAFLKRPSSNWLTAFIAKELTQSREIIEVRELYIQEAMTYLISRQKGSGAWDDPNPLYDNGMKGGVGQAEDDAPLTAFILLSMKHAMQVYDLGTDTELRVAMEKAKSYLVQNLPRLQNPYALAITAYALSLIDPESSEARLAHRNLMEMATCDISYGTLGVTAGRALNYAISIEATGYALLHALIMQDKAKALRIATWLTEQRKYGGGFRSTQDTVVALEALSKFSIQNNDVEDLDLTVEMCLNDKQKEDMRLTKHNALTLTAIQVRSTPTSGNYKEIQGTLCRSTQTTLNLSTSAESPDEDEEQLDDYYNYDTDEGLERREEPMSREDWFDLRTRRKRHAPEQLKKESTLVYTVCAGLKTGNSSSMVVVDISLLSGLKPNIQDLEDNVKGTERYIDHYDFHHNKVFLYFNKLTEETDCVRFRVEQIIPIGLVQPAAAVLYDYYSPDRRCSIFYTAPKSSPMLSKLCEADVCTCAEGGCPRMKVTFSKNMEEDTRSRYACFSSIVDYVYTVKILNYSDDGVFITYSTEITNVLQTGKDAAIQRGAYREMIQRAACVEVDMKNDAEYLIMGTDDSTIEHSESYILNNKMWIEEVPPEKKCKASRNRHACQLLKNFIDQHLVHKCQY
uniref:Complement C4 gamma chain n=1 Tax=Pygocentrus nattereri TaxID=42514 RepID=A0AAR2KNK1_PYGNA